MYKCLTVQVTTECNMECAFCFSDKKKRKMLKINEFISVLKFAHDSGVEQIEITGGEPFLHPQLPDFVSALMVFKRIFIFSNMTIPNCIEKILSNGKIDCKKISISVNSLNQAHYTEEQRIAFNHNVETASCAGVGLILGRTFYKNPFILDDLVEMSIKYNLPRIRVSIANPSMVGIKNEWMSQQSFRYFCKFLHEYVENNKNRGISIRWGCPIIPCFADEKDIEFFEKENMLSRVCRVHVGISVDLNVGHCYIMQNNCKKLNEFSDYFELKEYIKNEFQIECKRYMPSKLCQECKWKVNNCTCGCVGQWAKDEEKG